MFWLFLVWVWLINVLGNSPNFLIFFADDMGYGDLSLTGNPVIHSPNIDQLARQGLFLTQFYAGHNICSPSRAALLTGRLPIRSGCAGLEWYGSVFNSGAIGGLPHNETTFAESLKEVGYDTKVIGKWHLGQREEYLPFNHGFDSYYGIPFSVDMATSNWAHRGIEPVDLPILPLINNVTIIEQPVDLSTITQRYTNQACDFIKLHQNNSNNNPFLLYLAYSHVHIPDFVSVKFCNSSIRGRFGDTLNEMDDSVGQVMNCLKSDNNTATNTLVIFTSDNGPWLSKNLAGGSAGLFREGKHTNWEGGIRVPGIFWWPNKIPANTRSTAVAATYDIFTTILNLANAKIPNDRYIDGMDLSNILFNPTNGISPHDCLYIYGGTTGYCVYGGADRDQICPGLWAMRCGKYKMHWVTSTTNTTGLPRRQNPPLLYNIEHDPSELHPIWPNNVHYNNIRNYFESKKQQHLNTIQKVPNQMAKLESPNFWPCCDWKSKQKYPSYPECTCNPENWNSFVCTPLCYDLSDCGIYT